jgi:hypothetical protein
MRSAGYAVGVFCFLIASIGHSEDVRGGKFGVKASPPAGFCELDKTNVTDVEFFDAMSNFARVAGFSVIAAYPDCRELADARKSHAFISTKLAIFKWAKTVDRPPSQFISEACDQVRKSGLSDEQKARVAQYITEFSKGNISLKDVLPIGVIDEVKGTVCYSAKLLRARIANNGDVSLVYLSALTSIDNRPIMIAQWTNLVDSTSITTALTNLKTTYAAFATANGKD